MALLNLWEQRQHVAIGTCFVLNFCFFKFHPVGIPPGVEKRMHRFERLRIFKPRLRGIYHVYVVFVSTSTWYAFHPVGVPPGF